jgi:hypothetical protein
MKMKAGRISKPGVDFEWVERDIPARSWAGSHESGGVRFRVFLTMDL